MRLTLPCKSALQARFVRTMLTLSSRFSPQKSGERAPLFACRAASPWPAIPLRLFRHKAQLTFASPRFFCLIQKVRERYRSTFTHLEHRNNRTSAARSICKMYPYSSQMLLSASKNLMALSILITNEYISPVFQGRLGVAHCRRGVPSRIDRV